MAMRGGPAGSTTRHGTTRRCTASRARSGRTRSRPWRPGSGWQRVAPGPRGGRCARGATGGGRAGRSRGRLGRPPLRIDLASPEPPEPPGTPPHRTARAPEYVQYGGAPAARRATASHDAGLTGTIRKRRLGAVTGKVVPGCAGVRCGAVRCGAVRCGPVRSGPRRSEAAGPRLVLDVPPWSANAGGISRRLSREGRRAGRRYPPDLPGQGTSAPRGPGNGCSRPRTWPGASPRLRAPGGGSVRPVGRRG
ncbi:hypothetical protein SAVIM338S_06103 [Streptomyces avidinii]